jgi:hypothetical protein
VRLEGLGQLKNAVTSSGIKPATFLPVNMVPRQTLPRSPVCFEQLIIVVSLNGVS